MRFKVSFSGEKPHSEFAKVFDGVGLLRGEYYIRKNQMWISEPEMQRIAGEYIDNVATIFNNKTVWYRTIDMPTNWINKLKGCDHKVDEQIDTATGLRGIRRSLAFPETFLIELKMIARLSERHTNLNILFPFIHDVSELKKAKEYLKMTTFNGKVGIMAEIPSTVLCLEKFLETGIDTVVVGLNDLTGTTLASRRDLALYNNSHPAVVTLLKIAVEKAKSYGVEITVAGKHNPTSIRISEELGFDVSL